MKKQLRIVALVGSLRRESYTRRVVNALRELAPEAMAIEIVPIGSLPLEQWIRRLRVAPTREESIRASNRDVRQLNTAPG